MHVGLIVYGQLDTISGGYLYDRQLVEYLQGQGDTVEVISLPWTRYGKHLLHNFDKDLLNHLLRGSFDILLQDELNHPSLFRLNGALKKQLNCPVVSIVHHLRSSEKQPAQLMPFYRWIERHYLRSVDGYIFNSETTRTAVEALAKEQKPHVVAYPAANHRQAAVDQAFVTKRAHEPGPLRLIFVGNVTRRKGCHVLLKALESIPKESWQLKIVGDMTVEPQYVKQMRIDTYDAGLSACIHWHGRLPDSDLASLLRDSHVLVMPSSYEGFGIVYLEGMQVGLPAIATTAGAAKEIITDGENGFLVPPDNPIELAKQIQMLVNDRVLLAQLSAAALERAAKHPTWEISMENVRQFLTGLVV